MLIQSFSFHVFNRKHRVKIESAYKYKIMTIKKKQATKGEAVMQSYEQHLETQRERVLHQLINYGCYKAKDGRHLYELSMLELKTMYTEIQKQRINSVLGER